MNHQMSKSYFLVPKKYLILFHFFVNIHRLAVNNYIKLTDTVLTPNQQRHFLETEKVCSYLVTHFEEA